MKMAQLSPEFFSKHQPTLEFWNRWKAHFAWSSVLVPLYQWENLVFVGVSDSAHNDVPATPDGTQFLFVLAPAEHLHSYFSSLEALVPLSSAPAESAPEDLFEQMHEVSAAEESAENPAASGSEDTSAKLVLEETSGGLQGLDDVGVKSASPGAPEESLLSDHEEDVKISEHPEGEENPEGLNLTPDIAVLSPASGSGGRSLLEPLGLSADKLAPPAVAVKNVSPVIGKAPAKRIGDPEPVEAATPSISLELTSAVANPLPSDIAVAKPAAGSNLKAPLTPPPFSPPVKPVIPPNVAVIDIEKSPIVEPPADIVKPAVLEESPKVSRPAAVLAKPAEGAPKVAQPAAEISIKPSRLNSLSAKDLSAPPGPPLAGTPGGSKPPHFPPLPNAVANAKPKSPPPVRPNSSAATAGDVVRKPAPLPSTATQPFIVISPDAATSAGIELTSPGLAKSGAPQSATYGESGDFNEKIIAPMLAFYSKVMILVKKDGELSPWIWNSEFHAANESAGNVSLEKPSPFRIVEQTQKSYHGYVVEGEVQDAFFSQWNNAEVPDFLTISPIIIQDTLVATILGISDKNVNQKTSLQACEKAAESLKQQLTQIESHTKSA